MKFYLLNFNLSLHFYSVHQSIPQKCIKLIRLHNKRFGAFDKLALLCLGQEGRGYRIINIIFFQTCMCDTTPDSCKRCCRMNLNTSCFVMQPEEMLPDGTPCKTGFCNKGVCEPTMTDIVVRIWGFFEDFNLNSVMRFLKVRFFWYKGQLISKAHFLVLI